jgi:hypothetical protein
MGPNTNTNVCSIDKAEAGSKIEGKKVSGLSGLRPIVLVFFEAQAG